MWWESLSVGWAGAVGSWCGQSGFGVHVTGGQGRAGQQACRTGMRVDRGPRCGRIGRGGVAQGVAGCGQGMAGRELHVHCVCNESVLFMHVL